MHVGQSDETSAPGSSPAPVTRGRADDQLEHQAHPHRDRHARGLVRAGRLMTPEVGPVGRVAGPDSADDRRAGVERQGTRVRTRVGRANALARGPFSKGRHDPGWAGEYPGP